MRTRTSTSKIWRSSKIWTNSLSFTRRLIYHTCAINLIWSNI